MSIVITMEYASKLEQATARPMFTSMVLDVACNKACSVIP